MTDIEQKALALVNEVRRERGHVAGCEIHRDGYIWNEALCRAIEQHEAFRQEVSDVVEEHLRTTAKDWSYLLTRENLARFIIAKPDPLDEAVKEAASKWMNAQEPLTDGVRAAIEKRGGKIVWGEG